MWGYHGSIQKEPVGKLRRISVYRTSTWTLQMIIKVDRKTGSSSVLLLIKLMNSEKQNHSLYLHCVVATLSNSESIIAHGFLQCLKGFRLV